MSARKYRIELFVFPDGQSVELMVFDEARGRRASAPAATAPAPGATPRSPAGSAPSPCCVPPPPREDLEAHKCPVCGSELVYPVHWDRTSKVSWTLHLRCPECETWREVTLGRSSIEQLNRELYFGAQALAKQADRITRRNFEDEVDRIVDALERDLILPMDF